LPQDLPGLTITEKQAVAGERLDSLKKELTVAETRRNQAANGNGTSKQRL